jgi:hypothetical protein
MFTKLDRWVRNRLRSYTYGRWRTIRWPGKRKPTRYKDSGDVLNGIGLRIRAE